MQRQRIFFGSDDPLKRVAPTKEEKLWLINRNNPESPFHKFVGNEKAVKKMQTTAFTALGRANHVMNELAFSIFGPSSAGKTTLARLYAEVVELPFLELSPKSFVTGLDLFEQIYNLLDHEGLTLIEVDKVDNYVLPPMIIFIDEVHALSKSAVNRLLKPTEYNDSTLETENSISVNCSNVTWMIATTDEGMLFDAFRTRFDPVKLHYLNKKDIAKIIQKSFPQYSLEECELIAHYNSRIPRKALAFARYVEMAARLEDSSLVEVINQVAENEGIDKFGMNEIHLRILKELGKHPVAKNRMSIVAGVKDEEVENYVMPWLLSETDDQKALVTVTSRGYSITEAGLVELKKRGLK